MKSFFHPCALLGVLTFVSGAAAAPPAPAAKEPIRPVRFDFRSQESLKKRWAFGGKQFGVPMTQFAIVDCKETADGKSLAVRARASAGMLITRIPEEVWKKYPVVRWRWRVLKQVSFTGKEPDDQAAVLYFGDGSMFRQFMVAYRWEHSYPLGDESQLSYLGGTLVRRICMRNAEAIPGKWYVEERNVVQDFRRAFGREPVGRCGLTIGANSQYSGCETLVEFDYIEFLPAAGSAAGKLGQNMESSERDKQK